MKRSVLTLILGILKAPLFLFLVLGFGLFLLYNAFLPSEKEEILISRQTVRSLVQSRQELSQEPLSDDDLLALIDNYADEEVLIREAYKQGLDKNNIRVRQQIIDLMKSSFNISLAKPTESQLRDFFEEYRNEFLIPELRNFKHVYYRNENGNLPPNLTAFLEEFEESGEDFNALGDPFDQGYDFQNASFEQCALFFGREFATVLFEQPAQSWSGPLQGEQGVHFILMEGVLNSYIPRFEDISAYLEESYLYVKNKENQKKMTQILKENYDIVIEGSEVE